MEPWSDEGTVDDTVTDVCEEAAAVATRRDLRFGELTDGGRQFVSLDRYRSAVV
ncbi:hypothetical protein LN042_12395 [Kitasatospora sp. RB6PN24]|uniref:hypothetical protein n=1 Tax=Kitasatospora humi TaxID=2893891 RepID=UPI001E533CA2|nr:hypothetical protein [Kitasatospora humi]MCC9307882.1 hypothetical protein [Kitasatospora humi]